MCQSLIRRCKGGGLLRCWRSRRDNSVRWSESAANANRVRNDSGCGDSEQRRINDQEVNADRHTLRRQLPLNAELVNRVKQPKDACSENNKAREAKAAPDPQTMLNVSREKKHRWHKGKIGIADEDVHALEVA